MSIDSENDGGMGQPFFRDGLWMPPGVEIDADMGVYPEDIRPANEKHVEAKFTLKFPVSMGGLFMQTSALERPMGVNEVQTTYGFIIARFYAGNDGPEDPGWYTREELMSIRDHIQFVLDDTQKKGDVG